MKVYVICDLEGTSTVVDHRMQCWFDGDYYQQARTIATRELNALTEGLIESGVNEIVAWDGHGDFPGGIDPELVHAECKIIIGAGEGGPIGLDSSFDAVLLLGLHAMAGTTKAVLAHSFMPQIRRCWLNELLVGEIGLNCATAGQFGLPTIFVSGDKAAIDEAKAIVPQIEGVIVKESLKPEATGLAQTPTLSLSPEKARERIKAGAKKAAQKLKCIDPFVIRPPYCLRTEFADKESADRASTSRTLRISETTIEVKGNDLLDM